MQPRPDPAPPAPWCANSIVVARGWPHLCVTGRPRATTRCLATPGSRDGRLRFRQVEVFIVVGEHDERVPVRMELRKLVPEWLTLQVLVGLVTGLNLLVPLASL